MITYAVLFVVAAMLMLAGLYFYISDRLSAKQPGLHDTTEDGRSGP